MSGLVTGLDGKTYPRPISAASRLALIARVHELAHDGASVRGIVETLGRVDGVRRSVGSVSTYLTRWRCDRCSGGSECAPEQSPTPDEVGAA